MAQDYVAQARALVGVRFRPQGRSVSEGLDCVGVVVAVFDLPRRETPSDYRLKGYSPAEAERRMADHFVRLEPAHARAGDVLLVEAGPAQLHAVMLTPAGHIHADARLRRVVEVPGPVPWPVLSAWRHPSTALEESTKWRR